MAEIVKTITVTDVGGGDQGDTVWRWDPSSPYIVRVDFPSDGETVTWEFARDLLVNGVKDEAGIADVHIRRCGEKFRLALSSPYGTGSYTMARKPLVEFSRATLHAVPRSRESMDVDGALAKILAGSDG